MCWTSTFLRTKTPNVFEDFFFPLLPCCQATFLQYQQLGKLNVWKRIKGEERRHLCCLLAVPFHCWEGVPLAPPADSQIIKRELGFIHLHLSLNVLALERDARWRSKSRANRFLNNRAGTDLRGPPVIFATGGQLLPSHHFQWDGGMTPESKLLLINVEWVSACTQKPLSDPQQVTTVCSCGGIHGGWKWCNTWLPPVLLAAGPALI